MPIDVLGTIRRLRRRPEATHPAGVVSGDGAADALTESEMGFLDHLEALRWHLIKGFAGIVVAVGFCLFFADWIIKEVLLGPSQPDFWTYRVLPIKVTAFVLQNRAPSGAFFAYMGTVFASGLILGLPFLIYQFWKFVEPGLYKNEREGLRFAAVGATLFFMLGAAFGYFFIVPLSLQFFAGFELSPEIKNEFDIEKYFSMITLWSFGVGALFELPVVIYFLAKLGVVTAAMLRASRKIAIVVILVVAAFITPPDPFSQILVSLPLFGLYELSILFAVRIERKRARQALLDAAEDEIRAAKDAAEAQAAERDVAEGDTPGA